jgi:DNA-binding NarL/FixJ family response regulator
VARDAVLESLRVRERSVDRAAPDTATAEVLRLLSKGRSTAEIATELGLRQTTIRNHIASLLAALALGVHTRLQAVIAARKACLIEP